MAIATIPRPIADLGLLITLKLLQTNKMFGQRLQSVHAMHLEQSLFKTKDLYQDCRNFVCCAFLGWCSCFYAIDQV